ncbi:MAG: hypothetical protein ISR00_00270 [Flavobacteriales bacterium]|nr:hypothetical protein [Flavobacteriales bacterium]MBL6872367.1 hypothetical protein [Flavobacteriales bacterium]
MVLDSSLTSEWTSGLQAKGGWSLRTVLLSIAKVSEETLLHHGIRLFTNFRVD